MLYQAYQAHSDVMGLVRAFADAALGTLGGPPAGPGPSALRNLTAAYELISRAGLTHVRPRFGIDRVSVGNRAVAVREVSERVTPFGTLLHFKKAIREEQPRVLLVDFLRSNLLLTGTHIGCDTTSCGACTGL